MADVFSTAKRSEVMSSIRSHGNKGTELELIRLFRLLGITGWRRGQPMFGKPDFVFRKHKVALFVDGCFWHGCRNHGTRPKTNARFWAEKIRRNKARDRLVNTTLSKAGWRVVRIWEHELLRKNATRLASRLRRNLKAPAPTSSGETKYPAEEECSQTFHQWSDASRRGSQRREANQDS